MDVTLNIRKAQPARVVFDSLSEFRLMGEPLREFQGVLTGVPEFHGVAGQMMKASDVSP